MKKIKQIAVLVRGGIVTSVSSNIPGDLIVEVIDYDNNKEEAEERWKEIKNNLPYTNY